MKRLITLILVLSLLLFLPACTRDDTYTVEDYRTAMTYYEDFKILQLTDLHLGIECDLDACLTQVKERILREQPDLTVLTGDSFMYANKSSVRALFATLNEACAEVTAERGERVSKFAVTFGNHDNQGDYSRYYINRIIKSYATRDGDEIKDGKYAAFIDYENDSLMGLTNYYIDLVDDISAPPSSVDVKYRLHIIDSNTYHFSGPDYDYDVIHEDQLAHVKAIREGATADKDYIGIAFFHIPLHEFSEAWAQYESAQQPELIGQGEFREGVLAGYENNGSYKALRDAGVVAFFTGHDHINYGDFIYHADSQSVDERAIFSYGVKANTLLYHDADMIGYKTVTLKDVSLDTFLSIENVTECFRNVREEENHAAN